MNDPTLATLYEQHGHAVYRRCRYVLGDDDSAWDATQDVFLKAEKAMTAFEGRASWRTWLTRVSTNHCLNMLRSQRVRRGTGLVDVDALYDGAPCFGETSDAGRLVRGLLGRFDAKTQALAIHYYVDEMSQQEVAEALGLSVPTVRKRLRIFLRRARKTLDLPLEALR